MKSSLYNSICEPPTAESGACGSDLNIKLSADSLPIIALADNVSVVIELVADILPTTVNFSLGVIVPIPTLAFSSNIISPSAISGFVKCAIQPVAKFC